MWNAFNTGAYEGMIAETVSMKSGDGRQISAYYSRPLGIPNYPGIVLIPSKAGWDEFYRETARRFTQHNYAVLCPNIYQQFGEGTPYEITDRMKENNQSLDDADVLNDCRGSIDFLKQQPQSNGKVGVIGMCSGGRHTFMAACQISGIDAAVDCWGGGVLPRQEGQYAPIDDAKDLCCPLLGIFGSLDHAISPEGVKKMEEVLDREKKEYEFHIYEGAGHAFMMYDKPQYCQAQAVEAWEVIEDFFDRHLKQK